MKKPSSLTKNATKPHIHKIQVSVLRHTYYTSSRTIERLSKRNLATIRLKQAGEACLEPIQF